MATTTIAAGRIAHLEVDHQGPDFYRGGLVLIGDELELGRDLATAARLTYSRDELPGMLARDPAGIFAPMQYGRSVDQRGEVVLRPGREWDELPVGNADILTPSDPAWPTFLAALKRYSHGFDYPGRTDKHGWSTSNWGAARALHSMGYAVAETLAVFSLAGAETDDDVHYNLAEEWLKTVLSAKIAPAKAARRAQARNRRRAK